MDHERAKEVFSDEAFVKSLFTMNSPEEVQAALKGKGLDVTRDELMEIRDQIAALADKSGEMDEEQLKEAAGGIAMPIAVDPRWLQLGPILVEPQPVKQNRW